MFKCLSIKKKFKWCLVRYLNLADYYPARIRNIEK